MPSEIQPSSPITPAPRRPAPPRSARRIGSARAIALTAIAATVLLAAVVFSALDAYMSSQRFTARIQNAVITILERATGGRVEIQSLRWSVLHLRIHVDNLTIHGLEDRNGATPDPIPYFHVDSLDIDAKILSFLRPRIALSRLALQHPVFHLIVLPDGSTNQPHPSISSRSSFSPQTLFDLAVDHTQVQNGLILINNHAVPWSLAAGKLGLLIRFVPTSPSVSNSPHDQASPHYQASLAINDFTFRLQNAAQSHSALFLDADLTPQSARITHLEWNTATSKLLIDGILNNYAHPVWSAQIQGQVNLHEVGAVTGYDPLRHGTADVNLHAAGSADGEFSFIGHLAVQHGAFFAPWLDLKDVALDTHVQLDNQQISLTQFTSDIHGDGHINGRMLLTDWLTPTPPAPLPVVQFKAQPLHWYSLHHRQIRPAVLPRRIPPPRPRPLQALIDAQIVDLNTPMILAATATRNYADIGFTAEATGPVRATWHGAGIALDVHGDLTFHPEHHPRPGAIPVHGFVKADYLGDHERLDFQQADLFTPGTQIHAAGIMTLLPDDLQSSMHGTVTASNLQEFDRLIYVVNYTFPNSSASTICGPSFSTQSILPIHLVGNAYFHGNFTGSLMEPRISGHVDAGSFYLQKNGFGPRPIAHPVRVTPGSVSTLPWDSLHGDVVYTSPQIDVQHAVLAHGNTLLHADVQVRPVLVAKDTYAFTPRTGLTASMRVDNAAIADLEAFLGTPYPATGTLSANAHVHGTVSNLVGSGLVTLAHARIDGQPVDSASSTLSVSGHQIQSSSIVAQTASGQLTGNVSYDYLSHAIAGSFTGSQFDLAQIPSLQTQRAAIGGIGNFQLQLAGTTQTPIVTGSTVVNNITLNQQPLGQLHADARLNGQIVALTAQAQLLQTHLNLGGQVDLTPGLPARLQMNFSDFDIHSILQLYARSDISGTSAIRGQAQLNGPLLDPRHLQGEANLDRFSATLDGIPLSTYHPVHASLQDGLLRLYPVHIRGTDTDLKLQGTVQLFGTQTLRAHAEGAINAALIKTFDNDLTATGHLDFLVDARGTWQHPHLAGTVHVKSTNVVVRDLTNGLTDMNGELSFDQDRLVIHQLTGSTGGGQLNFTGFANFGQGLFVDVAADAKAIRIRYPQGVISTADLHLHLNGAPDSLLLRGNVQLTHFAISQNVDLTALAAASQSVSAPPDPTSFLHKVHLDVLIASTPQLGFQNSFASLAGDVNFHVRGTLANPSLLGRVDITQGKATFAGTQYTLQRGDVVFSNPVSIEPEVNLQASARVRDYDIIIGLTGPASKLQVNYRSEPPLSQSDVLALLTLGRTNEEAAMYGEQEQANSNPDSEALLGGALNAAVSNRVQQLFGVASVRVDPNFVGVLGQSTARVTVEQQVGRDITLVFATNVNTTAQQLLQAEYDITRNLAIIAVRDEADVFSLYFQIRGKHR